MGSAKINPERVYFNYKGQLPPVGQLAVLPHAARLGLADDGIPVAQVKAALGAEKVDRSRAVGDLKPLVHLPPPVDGPGHRVFDADLEVGHVHAVVDIDGTDGHGDVVGRGPRRGEPAVDGR